MLTYGLSKQDRQTIEDCLERVRLGWNSGDAHVFARQFTHDATYVIYLGEALLGRTEIESNHVHVLGKWERGSKMSIKVIEMKRLDEHSVSVLTAGGIGKRRGITYDKLQTFTFTRQNEQWLCAAFQNTAMSLKARRMYNPRSKNLSARVLGIVWRGKH